MAHIQRSSRIREQSALCAVVRHKLTHTHTHTLTLTHFTHFTHQITKTLLTLVHHTHLAATSSGVGALLCDAVYSGSLMMRQKP